MKRTARSDPNRSDLTAAKRPRTVPNPATDRRFWGLSCEDSARVVDLYDEGRLLIADYNKAQQEVEARRNLLEESARGPGEWDFMSRWDFDFEYEFDDTADEEEQLRHAKLKYIMDKDTELYNLVRDLEAASYSVDRIATACADLQLCSSLTAIILAKLPRELRDHVYDYLWTGEHVKSMDKAISFVPQHCFSDEAVINAPELPVPRFANVTFVGLEFASEAATRYFRVLSSAELDYRYVRAHLERNRFGPMRFSVKNEIRRLVMTIDESAGTIYPGTRIAREALNDSMNSLLMFKDHQNISIEIYLEAGMQWSLAFYQALEVIKPVFMTLREANIDIKVLGYDFFSTTEDDDTDILSEQLNHYLTAGKPEEWLDMKAREVKSIPRGLLRQRCKRTLRIMRKNLEFYIRDSRKATGAAIASL
ncbi:hypothetical protein AG0111_0g5635 [Alternaria gaisen]|uniref:Uncharacterized protein n=1 Tax=Alternaria gaisen TaxID=167740 RepID=A0ACB6FMM3_9PLEO|nr:hypothetical protein AG0111_0g5635 [Alternaria gaisen]